MITGTVNDQFELVIRLPVRDAAGLEQEIEALLDTGFNGSLTLPPLLIGHLGLPWHSRGSAILANGNIEQFDVYAATVSWDSVPRPILVEAVDGPPLLGMALLAGYDLRARVIVGGSVHIETVP